MERQRFKLCSTTFANGHFSTSQSNLHYLLSLSSTEQKELETESKSSISTNRGEAAAAESEVVGFVGISPVHDHDFKEKYTPLVLDPCNNLKKATELAGHESSLPHLTVNAGVGVGSGNATEALSGSVVQDRESETEVSRKPTKRRSKRTRKPYRKQDFSFEKLKSIESPVMSSVTDTCSEEDLAMCLMMLSRDVDWVKRSRDHNTYNKQEQGLEHCQKKDTVMIKKVNKSRKCSNINASHEKSRCEKCFKLFQSSQALGSHRRVCNINVTELRTRSGSKVTIFECPYCFKLFGSGQALGGHKRSHLLRYSMTRTAIVAENSAEVVCNADSIDLNLPAPTEDD